ncbi:unnamed protein product [Alternaria sp. RS040]
MELLDLPTEVFERIIRSLNSEAFQTYITYDVLAAPSLFDYKKTRAGTQILKHKLADFLYTRSINLNGFVHALVPNFINRIMYISKSWITGDQAISTLRRVICELFVRNCDGALSFVLTGTNKPSIQDKQETMASSGANLIATAAAIGDLYILRIKAAEDKDLLWAKSPAFGFPLDVAVYAGHFGVAKAIAQQAVTNRNKDVVDNYRGYNLRSEHRSFRQAICTCIELQHRGMTHYLLEKYVEAFGSPTETCMAVWLNTAVTCGHEDILRLLLYVPTEVGISTLYRAFEAACHLSKVSLLYLFFRPSPNVPGRLAINRIYSWRDKNYASEYPLNTAMMVAEQRHMRGIIVKLLELGADPNGSKYRSHSGRPLRLAFDFDKCVSGILPLLDAGANPHLIDDDWWIELQWKRFAETSVIGKALRKALKCHAKPKPAKEVEGFLAEVDEKIKEDTVAVKDVNLVPASSGYTQS